MFSVPIHTRLVGESDFENGRRAPGVFFPDRFGTLDAAGFYDGDTSTDF